MLDWVPVFECKPPRWHSAKNPYVENVDSLDRPDLPGSPATRDQKARVAPEDQKGRGVALVRGARKEL
jgi:hypothetical protein